jgi:hypothetical protein
MASEISITATNVDLDRFITAVRALSILESDVSVTVKETPYAGPARTIWGRVLADAEFDPDSWREAEDEVADGCGTIERITPTDGPPFWALIYNTPYRDETLRALHATGSAVLDLDTTFIEVVITLGHTTLSLSFDTTKRATGRVLPPPSALTDVPYLSTSDNWVGRDGVATAADHIRVIGLIDLLRSYATVDIIDTTDYDEHRDEIALIAAMAIDREWRADLRHAFASLKD